MAVRDFFKEYKTVLRAIATGPIQLDKNHLYNHSHIKEFCY